MCSRCTSAGRECVGYEIWGGGGAALQESPSAIHAKRALAYRRPGGALIQSRGSYTILPSLPEIKVSSEEHVYLDWFIHGTATNTPCIFSSLFWDPIILQAAKSEPMVLGALLVLSSAHKRKTLEPASRAREGVRPDAQEIFLLKQYSVATNGMKTKLLGVQQLTPEKLFLAMLTCSLFVLMEHLRGNFDTAYVHLRNGMQIVKQFIKEPSEVGSSLKLFHFFFRLLDQTEVFRARKDTPSRSAPGATLRFNDIDEARYHLNDLIALVRQTVEQLRTVPRSAKESHKLLLQDIAYLEACFESWRQAYDATMRERAGYWVCGEKCTWKALRQEYDIATESMNINSLRKDVLLVEVVQLDS